MSWIYCAFSLGRSEMLDSPRAEDIVEAVARLLREKLMATLPQELSFQTRVAANALDLVSRELRNGKRLEEEAKLRLQQLLNKEGSFGELEAELSARIRNGNIDPEVP